MCGEGEGVGGAGILPGGDAFYTTCHWTAPVDTTECARASDASPAQRAGPARGGIPAGRGPGARAGAEGPRPAAAGPGSGAPAAAIMKDGSLRVAP